MQRIIYKKKIIKGNVSYFVYGENSTKPIFLLHGLFGSTKDWFSLAKKLALNNYFVVILQAKWHGNRMPLNFFELFSGKSFMASMTFVMNDYVKGATIVLDYLASEDLVQEDRAGVIGFSMGAYVSYLLPLFDDRFNVIVPINGSAYYNDEKAVEHFNIENLEMPQSASIEAARKPKVFENKDILIIHTKDDQTISYFGSEQFFNLMSPRMKKGSISCILQEKGGHKYHDFYDEIIIEWIKDKL